MVKSTKKAFTLVELIVVITILAILGTIAFISLSGYSAEARDSRRVTNISNLTDKINIELVKGDIKAGSLVDTTKTVEETWVTPVTSGVYWTGTSLKGITNFAVLKENHENFRDPLPDLNNKKWQDYPLAIAIGGSWSWAFQFIQMAASMEAKNVASVRGNFFDILKTGQAGLILSEVTGETTKYVKDGEAPLPYTVN